MDFNLLPGMIDTHFHAGIMEKKGMDVRAMLKTAFDLGFDGGIDIGLTPSDFEKRMNLLEDFPEILLSTGCYPSEVERAETSALLEELEITIQKYNPAAIGEIGLDWHWDYGTRKEQRQLFEGQIALANRYKLPILVHNREADGDILEILSGTRPDRGGIIHCFSSGYSEAKQFLGMGMYISFAGNLTYKKNEGLRETASRIPIDRILLETDSPYLSPQKRRGKPNHPGHMGYTYEILSDVLGMDLKALVKIVKKNYTNLTAGLKKEPNQ